jgi:hypothetical protein
VSEQGSQGREPGSLRGKRRGENQPHAVCVSLGPGPILCCVGKLPHYPRNSLSRIILPLPLKPKAGPDPTIRGASQKAAFLLELSPDQQHPF